MDDPLTVADHPTVPIPVLAPPPARVSGDLSPRVPPGAALREAVDRATSAPGPAHRLGASATVVLLALVGLVAIAATDQIVPASSAHQAQLRIWLASRAAGIAALGMLAVQIVTGLVLSHPTNKTTWQLSRAIIPWHETLWLFVLAFVGAHVVAIILDPYAGVGFAGAFVPGLSSYRSAPVALGSIALDALLVTGLTARWTRLLPAGAWLVIHRAALAIFVLAWMHGVLAGTDSAALLVVYIGLAGAVGGAAVHRFWTRTIPRFEPDAAS